MENTAAQKHKKLDPKKRNVIIGIVLLVIVLIFAISQFMTPQRSVAAYCKVYKEEKTRLAALPGTTWPSGVFDDSLSDASEFAKSFGRLEQFAPDEIRPDIATLQSIYQKMHDDPSQAIAASLSGLSAESNIKEWTVNHCETR